MRVPALVLVAAVAEGGLIGRGNALPWRLSSDLRHFRALTLGRPVVMGRRTYASIGRPLPGRTTIVVTRDAQFAVPGAVVAGSLEAALAVARGDALRRGAAEIMVVGGGELYAQALPLADRLEITEVRVHLAPRAGDVVFPAIDPAHWQEIARREVPAGPGDEAAMAFVTYARRVPPAGRVSL